MASTTVKSIQVALTADTAKFSAQMDKAAKSTSSLSGVFKTFTSGLSEIPVLGSMVGGLGAVASAAGFAAAAVGGFSYAMKSAFSTIHEAVDASIELGILPNQFLTIQAAAGQANVGIEEIGTSLRKATVAAGEALSGDAAAMKKFDRLGISINQIRNADPYTVLKLIGDGLANIENPAQRTAAAVDIFGKTGTVMLKVLEGGGKTLDDVQASMEGVGYAVSVQGRDAVEGFVKKWAEMKMAIMGVAITLWDDFGPAIVMAVEQMGNVAKAIAWVSKQFSELVGGKHEILAPEVKTGPTRLKGAFEMTDAELAPLKITQAQAKVLDEMAAADAKKLKDNVEGYFDDLNKKLADIEKQYAKPITAQEQFMQQLKDINKLYETGIIDLEKRNQLLRTVSGAQEKAVAEDMAKQQQAYAKWMQQRSDMIVGTMRSQMDAELGALNQFKNLSGPAAVDPFSSTAFSKFQENAKGLAVADAQLAIQKKMERHLLDLKQRGVVLAEAKL